MTENKRQPMTDPTPAPTFTAEDYDRTADRMQADVDQARAHWYGVTNVPISADEPEHWAYRFVLTAMLRFAARRARQTCETCKFAGGIEERRYLLAGDWAQRPLRKCRLVADAGVNHVGYQYVPLTVHGQPFGCFAHEPKVAASPGTGGA